MAFTGKATYDAFDEIAEDVSDIVGMISPSETRLLDRLGDPEMPARNVLHEWQEDALGPGTIINSTAIASATAATAFQINGRGLRLQVGDVLRYTGAASLSFEEYLQITVVTGANSITCSRGFGGVGPSSTAAGGTIEFLFNAALEGADAGNDISGARSRKTNPTQIFQKPVQVSGTRRAVSNLSNIGDEKDYQATLRTREVLRDLEKAVIMGVAANTIGDDSAYRTMGGLWRNITTNVSSATTVTSSYLSNVVMKGAWTQGASDLDILVASANWKALIDDLAESRIQQGQDEDRRRAIVNRFEGTYGLVDILPANRWMPPLGSLLVLASGRLEVKNLQGRSFMRTQLAKTGDSDKEQILGEYTLEYRNQEGFAKGYVAA